MHIIVTICLVDYTLLSNYYSLLLENVLLLFAFMTKPDIVENIEKVFPTFWYSGNPRLTILGVHIFKLMAQVFHPLRVSNTLEEGYCVRLFLFLHLKLVALAVNSN